MTRKLTTVLATVLALTAATTALPAQESADAETEGSWIHVRVDETDGAKVAINLPMSLVDVALEIGQEEGFDEDDLRLDPEGDVTIEDLRRMWAGLKDAGDAELVEVHDGDEHVRVYKRGDRVHVDVDEDGVETVRVEMPAAIVDALLSGEGDRLDLPAAARELARIGDQEVVRIDDEGTTVRIWVDRVAGARGS